MPRTGKKESFSAEETSKSRIKQSAMNASTDAHANAADQDITDPAKRVELLEHDLQRRQESYIRRERQYKSRIDELEAQLAQKQAKKSTNSEEPFSMDSIRGLHRNIIDNVDKVQMRTSKILQEQEKDLLRAFRARLYDVQKELEKEKNKTDDGASAWIEKSKQLEAEVNWSKEMSDRLDRLNQSLMRENQRLKNQFSTQENDREFLVRQLVSVKKDNARLRMEYEKLMEANKELTGNKEQERNSKNPNTASTSVLPRPGSSPFKSAASTFARPVTAAQMQQSTPEADNRYREIIKRLKRLLEVERRNLRQVRQSYSKDLEDRTELEMFLKQCIDDVKEEITQRKASRNPKTKFEKLEGTQDKSKVDVKDFGPADRERVMETLLSQQRVISLLYSKTFPPRGKYSDTNTSTNFPKPTEEEISSIYADSRGTAANSLIKTSLDALANAKLDSKVVG